MSQVRHLHKSGISEAYVIQCAHKIYKNKNPKNLEFGFEYSWSLVKGFLHWAKGWGSMWQSSPTPLHPVSSARVSQDILPQSSSVAEGMGDCDTNQVLRHYPSGFKGAKLVHKEEKLRDSSLHAQVEAIGEGDVKEGGLHGRAKFALTYDNTRLSNYITRCLAILKLRMEKELEKYEARRATARTLNEKQIAKHEKCRLEAKRAEAARLEREARNEEETIRQLRVAATPVDVGDDDSAGYDDMEGGVCDWPDDVDVHASIEDDNLHEGDAQVIDDSDKFEGLIMTPNHGASPLTSRHFTSPLSMSPACEGMIAHR